MCGNDVVGCISNHVELITEDRKMYRSICILVKGAEVVSDRCFKAKKYLHWQ